MSSWRTESPRPCQRCGHAERTHQHYRRGTDCALCSCPKFVGSRVYWRLVRLWARLVS